MSNKVKTSRARTAVKSVREAVATGDLKKATELLQAAQSLLSKLAKSSAMKKETASRKVSRLTKAVKTISAAK